MNNNKLILGTVQLGLEYGINNKIGQVSEFESIKILNLALKNNIIQLDTAESYGSAHKRIGDFHKKNPQNKFLINTKISKFESDDSISSKIKSFLNELEVGALETLMFHSFASYFEHQSLIVELNQLKNSGKIKNIGVSIYTNDEFEKVIEDPNIEVIQIPFNLLDNFSIRGNLIQKAKKRNKIIHSRSAFLQGLFYKSIDDEHHIVTNLKSELLAIKTLAFQYNFSVSELALCYCLQQPLIDKVIIGVDSSNQLQSNIEASQKTLPNELLEKINNIFVSNSDLLNPSLW